MSSRRAARLVVHRRLGVWTAPVARPGTVLENHHLDPDVEARQTRCMFTSSSARSDSSSFSSSSSAKKPGTSMSIPSAFAYCATRVRQSDYENFLCLMWLPKEHRPAALALRAFNVETASALGVTKEPQLALMRLRWWRDVVDAIHDSSSDDDTNTGNKNNIPDHPVAIALHSLLGNGKGSARTRRWLKQVADARVKDAEMGMEHRTPSGVQWLEMYAENSSSSLLYAQLDLGGIRDTNADHAASHLGKAVGITNLLRGTKHHAGQRRCYLPIDVCAKHGLAVEDLYRFEAKRDAPTDEALKNAVHEVASLAKQHLDSASAMAGQLAQSPGKQSGKSAKQSGNSTTLKPQTVLLPAAATRAYLENLERLDFDVYHPALLKNASPLFTFGKIAWAAVMGKY
jgi:NADH dehydrogenase [ubiquinone] 1 alpha subcomplex assembly factor 6